MQISLTLFTVSDKTTKNQQKFSPLKIKAIQYSYAVKMVLQTASKSAIPWVDELALHTSCFPINSVSW